MEGFLIGLLEILAELLVDVAVYWPFDWTIRNKKTGEDLSLAGACTLLFLAAGAIAAVSLLIVPKAIISVGALRIANLVLAPVAAGAVFAWIARWRARRDDFVEPCVQFWHAFWFTLGWVLVRFVFVKR